MKGRNRKEGGGGGRGRENWTVLIRPIGPDLNFFNSEVSSFQWLLKCHYNRLGIHTFIVTVYIEVYMYIYCMN